MTREELKLHCLTQIEMCEMWARHRGEEPHGKIYEEHKLILELLEKTWSLDAAREDFIIDVYNTLDFLPTNNEVYRIISSFDRVTSGIKQEHVLGKITEIIEPLRHLSIDEMSDIEWQILQVINKYMAENEDKK